MPPQRAPAHTPMTPGNRLLAALPEPELARLRPALNEIEVERSQVLYEPGVPVTHTWFPITCVLSQEEVLDDARARL